MAKYILEIDFKNDNMLTVNSMVNVEYVESAS